MDCAQCKDCPVAEDITHCNAQCVACQHGLPPPSASHRFTPLPRSVEDKILGLFNDLSGLPPMKILLLMHIYAGGSLSTFGQSYREMVSSSERYGKGGVSRSLAHVWWKDLEDRFGWVVALHTWRARGEGRKADDGCKRLDAVGVGLEGVVGSPQKKGKTPRHMK